MVPNWSWATFEQVNNPGRCDILGCVDSFGAVPARVPPASPSAPQNKLYPACTKTEALTKLFAGAKIDPAFANYCLKGSQTDFTDPTGAPIRLGNSVTESGFVETASCMGCHSRAAYSFVTGSWAETGVMLYNYTPIAPIGIPDPAGCSGNSRNSVRSRSVRPNRRRCSTPPISSGRSRSAPSPAIRGRGCPVPRSEAGRVRADRATYTERVAPPSMRIMLPVT
ncbi:MAG: hypothetical protein WDN69_02430 [Aliidongia sp.]